MKNIDLKRAVERNKFKKDNSGKGTSELRTIWKNKSESMQFWKGEI